MTVSILVDIIIFCNFAVVKAEGHFRKPPCEFFNNKVFSLWVDLIDFLK